MGNLEKRNDELTQKHLDQADLQTNDEAITEIDPADLEQVAGGGGGGASGTGQP